MVQSKGPGSKRPRGISGKNPSNCKREKECSELPPISIRKQKTYKVTFQMITFVPIWN
jgi:hypothetical protein